MAQFKEENTNKKHISFKSWAKLFKYVHRYRYLVLLCIILMLFVSFYDSSFVPSLNYSLTDYFDQASMAGVSFWEIPLTIKIFYIDFHMTFKFALILYAVFILIRSLCVFGSFYIMNFFEMYIMCSLREDGFKHIQELSFSYFDRTNSGWLIARLENDCASIGEVISWSVIRIFWIIADVIFTLITMFQYSWQYSLILLASTPLCVLIVIYFNKQTLKYHRLARSAYSYFVGWLSECISGAKTIKTLAIEGTTLDECEETTHDVQKKRYKSNIVSTLFQPSITLLGSFATITLLLLYVFYFGDLKGSVLANVATIVLFLTFVNSIYSPIQQFAEIANDMMETQASVEKMFALLDAKPELIDSKEVVEEYGDLFNNKKENFPDFKGDIEFNNVCFSYIKDTEVIHNMNLNIKEGTSVAIVGETGSGKSTTVNLLCRFYEPTTGKILIDGIDYKNRSVGWLRSNIGYVQQVPFIFKGTIKDNVRYGKLDATDEEIINACKIVDVDGFINTLKDKYDTFLEDGGNELSQGQKQLIAFARAIVRNPKLLILDEATSSIDTETEAMIQNAIDNTLKGRTSIIIAHRLSTIVNCDRIIVMKDGVIIEDGNHKELMEKHGYYHSLYMNQFKELDIDNQLDIYKSQIEDKGINL